MHGTIRLDCGRARDPVTGRVQVFEQLFQLYEQKLPKRAERDFRNNMFIDPRKYEYMCAPVVHQTHHHMSHCQPADLEGLHNVSSLHGVMQGIRCAYDKQLSTMCRHVV